jgi:drug/metabolite transporter (DMT)-like permease
MTPTGTSVDPRIKLLISRTLASMRPAVIAFLVANGAALSGGMPSAISFCNVLFVGNLCAALVILAWFGPRRIGDDLRVLPPRLVVGLVLNGGLASLLSALIFTGLEYTSATNTILLSRLAPVLFALAGAMLFRQRISRSEWLGFGFIVVGTLLLALLEGHGALNQGDGLILLSTVVFAVTAINGKLLLTKEVSLPVLVFMRNASSSLIFFAIATALFGFHHFADLVSGSLWIVMSVYALLIICMSDYLWYDSVDSLDSIAVGRWATPAPAIAVLFSATINHELPSRSQLLSFLVIMVGVLITAFGRLRPPAKQEPMAKAALMADGDNLVMPVS